MKRGDAGRGRDASAEASRRDQPANQRWGSRDGDPDVPPDGYRPAGQAPPGNGSGAGFRGRPADGMRRGYGPAPGAGQRFGANGQRYSGNAMPGQGAGPPNAAGPRYWPRPDGDDGYRPDGQGYQVPPSGRQFLPNGRRIPPRGDRQFRAPGQAPGPYRAPFAQSGPPGGPGNWADGQVPYTAGPADALRDDAIPGGGRPFGAMNDRGPRPGRRWPGESPPNNRTQNGARPDGMGHYGGPPEGGAPNGGSGNGGRPGGLFQGGRPANRGRPAGGLPDSGRLGGGPPGGGRPAGGFPNGARPGGGRPSGGFPNGERPGGGRRPYGYAGPQRGRPRPQVPPGSRIPDTDQPPIAAGLIRQRDSALPERDAVSGSQPIAALAPDGLESFARDLRVLRARAELDYPEMAERSHYTMKTLASAAGGLRLPSLPVTVAYVQACGGDMADWEERWHKLAEKLGTEPAPAEIEPAVPLSPAAPSGPAPSGPAPSGPFAAEDGTSDEVYVITSAKPRQPGR